MSPLPIHKHSADPTDNYILGDMLPYTLIFDVLFFLINEVNTMIYQFCPIPIPLNFGYGIHSPGSFGIYSCAFMAHFNAPAFYADLEGFYANGHVGIVGKKLSRTKDVGWFMDAYMYNV